MRSTTQMLLLALLATAEARLANVRAHEDLAVTTKPPDAKTTKLPKSFSWRDHDLLAPSWNQHVPRYCGACFAFGTAHVALRERAALRAGQTVLLLGTGGVSLFALQFAKAAGATVIATSSSNEKLERVRELGADHLINYKEVEAWGPKALEITGGRGVDCVVEIGGAGTLDQSMLATRVGGHVALIGVLAGFAGPVQTALLFSKNLKVQGLTVGSRAMQQDMIAAIEANGIKPVISDTFALADLADAFRHQESGSHFGKIAVEI